MTLNPDLTDHITVHTDRKNGTLHVLLVDEIDDETLDEHATHMAAMAGDASTADNGKRIGASDSPTTPPNPSTTTVTVTTGWRNELVAAKRTLSNPVEAVKRPVFPVLPADG